MKRIEIITMLHITYSLRISLLLVLISVLGLYFEIINAFDYIQGARDGFIQSL